jgi:hypothetical protein
MFGDLVIRRFGVLGATALLCACGEGSQESILLPFPTDTIQVALSDLGNNTYLGFKGGLYPNGSNQMPDAMRGHLVARPRRILPLTRRHSRLSTVRRAAKPRRHGMHLRMQTTIAFATRYWRRSD